jgi:signal transduction histidine kinase
VDGGELPTELSPIVLRLNELLERLQNAFERERSFTADAAHELRTPLAGLEAALEVCVSRRRAPEAYETVAKRCLAVVRTMHGMIEGLLLLARADASQVPVSREVVDIENLLAESWKDFSAIAENRSLDVQWEAPADLRVETDAAKLRHILSNLLDNAVRYADAGGTILISTEQLETVARIRISNTGSRVSANDAAKVFERFWRGDHSRTATGTHSGLGLAVCSKLTDVLRGKISVTSASGGTFCVTLDLPWMGHASADANARDNVLSSVLA